MVDIDCGMCSRIKKYASGEEEYRAVYKSEHLLALYPSKPSAQVHIVIMTKKHIPTIFDLSDDEIAMDIIKAVKIASKEIVSLKGACKVEMYLGEFQNTKHFHCHVIYDPSIN